MQMQNGQDQPTAGNNMDKAQRALDDARRKSTEDPSMGERSRGGRLATTSSLSPWPPACCIPSCSDRALPPGDVQQLRARCDQCSDDVEADQADWNSSSARGWRPAAPTPMMASS